MLVRLLSKEQHVPLLRLGCGWAACWSPHVACGVWGAELPMLPMWLGRCMEWCVLLQWVGACCCSWAWGEAVALICWEQ